VLFGIGGIEKTPTALLHTMSIATGTGFVILFFAWLITMRRHKPALQS
jgi:hypothetical protein